MLLLLGVTWVLSQLLLILVAAVTNITFKLKHINHFACVIKLCSGVDRHLFLLELKTRIKTSLFYLLQTYRHLILWLYFLLVKLPKPYCSTRVYSRMYVYMWFLFIISWYLRVHHEQCCGCLMVYLIVELCFCSFFNDWCFNSCN